MRITLAFLAAALLAAPAFAHDPSGPRSAVREACKAEAQNYCAGIRPGGGRIRACIHANRDRLSPGCKAAIYAAIQARREAQSRAIQAYAPQGAPAGD